MIKLTSKILNNSKKILYLQKNHLTNVNKIQKTYPEFEKIFNNDLRILEKIFKNYKYELKITGGAVRDLFAGK
jgi:hypothetical protein